MLKYTYKIINTATTTTTLSTFLLMKMVGVEGLEPTNLPIIGRVLYQLSYTPTCLTTLICIWILTFIVPDYEPQIPVLDYS